MSNLSTPTKIALGLLYIFIVVNLIVAFISLGKPSEGGEFAALQYFATWLFAIVIGGSSLVLFIASFFLRKQKRWAFFLSIILVALLLPILVFSDLKEITFDLSQSRGLSLTKEILPITIILLLILGRKDFKKSINPVKL